MGAQPPLDGLRAIAVLAVIVYHAGFGWMSGGFLGVEVFFVVSGFLITTLLIEEQAKTGRVSLRHFWERRARRLLPALGVLLVAVALWTWIAGTAEQADQLRGDVPSAIFYVSNWKQVFDTVPYYSSVSPPFLRHLWSLAVEEQWYLLWPLAFVAMTRGRRAKAIATGLAGAFLTVWLLSTVIVATGIDNPISIFGHQVDRTNLVYLSTITRSGGLLLGGALAFVWRPWRHRVRQSGGGPDLVGGAALGVLLVTFLVVHVRGTTTFALALPLVSIASTVAIAMAVHPGAAYLRRFLGSRPLVEIGRRSYGLYLWHWPVFVAAGATHGDVGLFLAASMAAAGLAELSFRLIETPARQGAIGRAFDRSRVNTDAKRRLAFTCTGAVAVVAVLGVHVMSAPSFDRAAGGSDVVFEAGATTTTSTAEVDAVPVITDAVGTDATAPTATAPPVTAALPRRVTIVGDSTAHSLAINLPKGIDATFTISDGSVEGCGVFTSGKGVSSTGFTRSFNGCGDVAAKWAGSVASNHAQIALVSLGAWEVLDLQIDGRTVAFGTAEFDGLFTSALQAAIDAISATGARVALLGVPCMRPIDAKGAGTPPLPERGNDERSQHLTALVQQLAQANAATTTFIAGPTAWCNDEAIATDPGYRWDGVHVYKPGANLIYTTIAPDLLAIPVS